MNLPNPTIDPSIQIVLDHLPPPPARNSQRASRGRAQFLSEAESLRAAVPSRALLRQNSWMNLFQRKERTSMSIVALVLVAISLALGGSGATVLAAQEAMPNDPLYAIKLATEDFRINVTSDVQTRAALEIDFANRRMQEIQTMASSGIAPSDAVMERQQSEIEMALRQAADMDDAALKQVLLRAQTMLQDQLQIVDRLRAHASDPVAPALDRVRERLRLQLELTNLGLRDPQQFREQMRQTTREQIRPTTPAAQPERTTTPTLTLRAQPTTQQQQSTPQTQPTAQQQQSTPQTQPTAQQKQSTPPAQPTSPQGGKR